MQKLWLFILILLLAQIECNMKNHFQKKSSEKNYYCFVKSCIHPETGLVRHVNGNKFTTPYANALAAMAFIHEKDFVEAEQIFRCFQRYYLSNKDHFNGLPQFWNVETGIPESSSIHWEGDVAFLALALNYYQQATEADRNFLELHNGLTKWLLQRAKNSDLIVAESIADMYAALTPFGKDSTIQKVLDKLRQGFFSTDQICSRDYPHNLNHIVRGFLVFQDTSGFQYYKNFLRTETWGYDGSMNIFAFSAFSDDLFIHVEISVQLLLALKLWGKELEYGVFPLPSEIEKLKLNSKKNSNTSGIPCYVTSRTFNQSCLLPALEPTCFLLFYFWGFNPYNLLCK